MLFATLSGRTTSIGQCLRGAVLAALLPARALAAEAPSHSEKRPESPPDPGLLSASFLAGGSVGDEVGSAGVRALFGYGARGGYRFPASRLYLGVTVMGYSDEVREDPGYGGMLYGTEQLIYTSIEMGAEYPVRSLMLRPYLGLGVLAAIYDTPPNSGSGLLPAVVPGIHARYPSGPLYLGLDARFELSANLSGALLGCIGLQLDTGGG